jgi:zinc transport system permease protein
MTDLINQILSYPFMVRALVVGILVSLCSALLGVNLVLKRYSMIGDGLSHVGFGAMAIATALNFAPLFLAVPFVLIAAILLLGVKENSRIKGDAAIAVITTGSLSVGIIVSSVSGGMNTDLMNYMFGSILSLSNADAILSIVLSLIIIVFYLFFYNGIFSVTFDEQFATATGIKTDIYRVLIAVLSAITVVLGMKMMGTLLISALLIFPPLSAMKMAKTFKSVVVLSAIISVICFILGLGLSFALGTPTGATVVVINLIVFLIAQIIVKK